MWSFPEVSVKNGKLHQSADQTFHSLLTETPYGYSNLQLSLFTRQRRDLLGRTPATAVADVPYDAADADVPYDVGLCLI